MEEGLAPLLNALIFGSKERQGEAESLLPKIFPLSLKGEGFSLKGIMGVRALVIGLKTENMKLK